MKICHSVLLTVCLSFCACDRHSEPASAAAAAADEPQREPSFQGRPLSYWMEQYLYNPPQAEAAIQSFGASAMPVVIDDLQSRDFERHRRAVLVCQSLGTNAQSALPYLEALLPKQSDELNVTGAITKTGTPGTFLLLQAFTNSSYSPAIKGEIIGALHYAYRRPGAPDPGPLIAYLTNQLTAPTAAVRRSAAELLGWVGQLPEISIGALGGLLDDPDAEVRRTAIASLGRFLHEKKAERFIRAGFEDANAEVRTAATNSLRELYPPPRPNYE